MGADQLLEQVERGRRGRDRLGEQIAQEGEQLVVQHLGQSRQVRRLNDLEELLDALAAAR